MVGGIEDEGESMPKTRKSHPPSLKAKVAAEAIKAHKTAAQIAQMFGVHPTQVGGWKKQALAGLPDIFGNGREQMRQQADADKDELYKQIGQLIQEDAKAFCCAEDEGGPFGAALWGEASNCRKLLRTKSAVVNVPVKRRGI